MGRQQNVLYPYYMVKPNPNPTLTFGRFRFSAPKPTSPTIPDLVYNDKNVVIVHELGHAIVAYVTDRLVEEISIVRRGNSDGHVTARFFSLESGLEDYYSSVPGTNAFAMYRYGGMLPILMAGAVATQYAFPDQTQLNIEGLADGSDVLVGCGADYWEAKKQYSRIHDIVKRGAGAASPEQCRADTFHSAILFSEEILKDIPVDTWQSMIKELRTNRKIRGGDVKAFLERHLGGLDFEPAQLKFDDFLLAPSEYYKKKASSRGRGRSNF